jgi:hypothetical protein
MKLSFLLSVIALMCTPTVVNAQVRGATTTEERSSEGSKQAGLHRGLQDDTTVTAAKTKFIMIVDGTGSTFMGMQMSGSLSVAGSSGGAGGSSGGGAGGGSGGSMGGEGCTSERNCGDNDTGGETGGDTTDSGSGVNGGGVSSSGETSSPTSLPTPLPTPIPTSPSVSTLTLPPFPPSNSNVCPNSYSASLHTNIEEGDDTKFCTSNSDCDFFFSSGVRIACCLYLQCLCGPFLRLEQCVPY